MILKHLRISFGWIAALAAPPLLTVSPAMGDVVSSTWTNSTLFNYRVTHMPDLDQKRDDLPCSGSIHCVPTCASNMVMFAANHGFPDVAPGPGYWEGDTNYDLASDVIELMGVLMGTSCDSGGTGGSGGNSGLSTWLIGNPELVVNDHLNLANFSVTFNNIGKSLCGDRIGSVSYGRYDVVGYFFNTPIVDRNGGHCTTAVKVRRNGNTRELWVRNPSSDEDPNDLNSQSDFINDIYDVQDITVIVVPGPTVKTVTAINYTAGDTQIRILDGHRTITPATGYSFGSSLTVFQVMQPESFVNPTQPPTTVHPSPTGTPILSLIWHDLTGEYLVVCAGSEVSPPSLHAVDPLTGASQLIPTTLPPVLVANGRSDNVYVSPGNEIMRILRPAPASPPPPTMLPLPHTAHAIVFDDANDEVVLLSRTDRKLMRFDRDLSGPPAIFNVPTSIPMGTQVQLAINPADNPTTKAVWLWSSATNVLYRLTPGSGGMLNAQPLSHPAIDLPIGLDFDNRGHMLVSNHGVAVELLQTSTGAWLAVNDSPLAGLPAFGHLRVLRTRTNFEPGVHDTPGWTKNIDPAELPADPQAVDCLADIAPLLDTDGIVDIDDLFAVIAQWGPCQSDITCVADINQTGIVDIDDLFEVISAWGACP